MRVLVTGGCGFIGSHIVDKLLQEKHDVYVIDNLITGNKGNIVHNIPIMDCDINSDMVDEVFKEFRPEAIIHHAAQVSVTNSVNDMLYDETVNIHGTLKLIEAARKYGAKKIIFASSAAVYGNTVALPIDLSHPTEPLSPYGVSKLSVEYYLKMAQKLFGIDYTILRYSNVYGPRQDANGEGGVIAIFSDCLAQNKAPFIYGDGKQTRDFVYVEDVASANVNALTAGHNEILNVSSGSQISIAELFETMKEASGQEIDAIYKEERHGDIRDSVLCNERTKQVLNWNPGTSLLEGLKRTLHYYNENVIS
ncbi:NAD-dependent epimerase/dehydratase family protein [Metabacillus fastidiosus]|uniref:NAD-dependent epimerase/dehydratase family protein n=1 Tax=Metabacillus fastidiosus TaxID=1458 RepID=UPI0008264F24|nr:NAD-dependent epimerase/dehydratase family protein [Metabacillus fastidiosus]MED4455979.1 NAD-dependent epimerase/dehydratase family protein [Metabacillus fastidiosus]MED4464472.1 NAD-dependent epimerase/dehydratase family protein [Metabacillus fastidiosus]